VTAKFETTSADLYGQRRITEASQRRGKRELRRSISLRKTDMSNKEEKTVGERGEKDQTPPSSSPPARTKEGKLPNQACTVDQPRNFQKEVCKHTNIDKGVQSRS